MSTETLPADLNYFAATPWTDKEHGRPLTDVCLVLKIAGIRYGHDVRGVRMHPETVRAMADTAEFKSQSSAPWFPYLPLTEDAGMSPGHVAFHDEGGAEVAAIRAF